MTGRYNENRRGKKQTNKQNGLNKKRFFYMLIICDIKNILLNIVV